MSVPSQLSLSNTRGTSVVKKYFSKFTMLIIAALSIANVVLGFMSGGGIGLPLILSAVVAVLLTMIYFSSKGSGNPKLFFGILHVISLIEFIGFILIALLTAVGGFFLVVAPKTILTFIKNNPNAFSEELNNAGISSELLQNTEALEQVLNVYRIAMLIVLLVVLAFLILFAIYINAQTTFLKSCKNSCNGTSVYYYGASAYGNLSIVLGFINLVFIVIAFLVTKSGEAGIEGLGEETASITAMAASPLILVTNIVSAVSVFLRGTFAKGWIAWAKENKAWVEDGNVATNVGPASSNAMNTFKSTQRKSNDAIHQSQAYTYGTDDDKKNQSPNKKSEYIPEELQNDYPQQYDQNMGGMMNDPFMGDPFAPPAPQAPYGQDPFAADPFAADPFAAPQPPMGGNPYGAPNPGDQGYNNGMM